MMLRPALAGGFGHLPPPLHISMQVEFDRVGLASPYKWSQKERTVHAETGRIYYTEEEIQAALKRGEPLIPVNEKIRREMFPQEPEPTVQARAVSFQSLLNEKCRQERKER